MRRDVAGRYERKPIGDDKSIITRSQVCYGKFIEKFELRRFPFDVQDLSIAIKSNRSDQEIVLQASDEPSLVTGDRAVCIHAIAAPLHLMLSS